MDPLEESPNCHAPRAIGGLQSPLPANEAKVEFARGIRSGGYRP